MHQKRKRTRGSWNLQSMDMQSRRSTMNLCVTSTLARYLSSYHLISLPHSIGRPRNIAASPVLNRRFGLTGTTMSWFNSYQANRKQQGAFRFGTYPVDCIVPQSSVLGPQWFNAYAEDLEKLIKSHHLGHPIFMPTICNLSTALELLRSV